nr:IS66 family insertion sequence element accessory protein TnpB [Bradyrhizobium sp. NBAIM02]
MAAAVAFALTVTWTARPCSEYLSCCGDDDPDSERRQGLDRHWPHRHASRHAKPGSYGSRELEARSHAGELYIFRGRRGDLVKILWHDGLGMSLYAKRLDRGKFIWPSASAGAVSISAAQMAYMLEGIDWRNPQLSWRPQSVG